MSANNGEAERLNLQGSMGHVLSFRHGHPEREFGPFGRMYHQAAKEYAERLRHKKAAERIDACPALFLYRHAIELYLKSIVSVGRTVFLLSGLPEPRLNGRLHEIHRLDHLLAAVTAVLKPLGIRPNSLVAELGSYADVRKIIRELSKIDERSYTFRCPFDTKGKPSVPRGTTLDIEGFANLFDSLLSFLAQCNSFLESRWGVMVAAHSQAKSEGRQGLWPEADLSGFEPR